MTLNKYFNYYEQNGDLSNEQSLLDNMLIESIQINGLDVYYIEKETNNINPLYGEDVLKRYVNAQPIEMYLESFDNFIGDDALAIMGLTVKDELNLMVSKTRFDADFGHAPLEGDLIMIPLKMNNQKGVLFEIRFVEDEQQFYPLGNLMHYQLKCSLYEHSNEEFDTNNDDIDTINLDDFTDDNSTLKVDDTDKQYIEDELINIVDKTEGNAFGEF